MANTLTVRNVARRPEATSTGAMLEPDEQAKVPDDEHTAAKIDAGLFIEIPSGRAPRTEAKDD